MSISKASLIIGCDIAKMDNKAKEILSNTEVIALNQDKLGIQGRKIKIKIITLPDGYEPTLTESELEVVDIMGNLSKSGI